MEYFFGKIMLPEVGGLFPEVKCLGLLARADSVVLLLALASHQTQTFHGHDFSRRSPSQ